MYISPINVYADNTKSTETTEVVVRNRTLIINSKVDPRVSAQKLSVTLMFYNTYTGDIENVILNEFSNYKLMTKFPAGDYYLFSGMVTNDLTGYYIVTCDKFDTYAATTEITVTIGNPEYKGEVEKVDDFLVGSIDREGTNELREQHGQPPVDWDEIDRLIEEGYYDIHSQNPSEEPNSTPQSTPDEVVPSESPTTLPTASSSTPTDSETPTDKPIDEETNKKNMLFAILFVVSVIGIAGVSIYYRNKNFRLDNDD